MKNGSLLVIHVLLLFLASCDDNSKTNSNDSQAKEEVSVVNVPYPDNFDHITERYSDIGFDKFDVTEKLVYCIWWFEGEVNIGGFHQFFFNSAGDYTNETLEALETIGALKTKKLPEKAVEIAFNGEPAPSARAKRNELLDRPTEEADEKLGMALSVLDEEFYKYEDPIADQVNKWLSKQK